VASTREYLAGVALLASFGLCGLSACANVTPDRADGARPHDATGDGGHEADSSRDVGLDLQPAADALIGSSDRSIPGSSDAYVYPPPSIDAAMWFDGCTSGTCATGQLCTSRQVFEGRYSSQCYGLPPCEGGVSCLCVVEAADWCHDPTCSNDGGVILTCHNPPPP
jgi:hypothetical protein